MDEQLQIVFTGVNQVALEAIQPPSEALPVDHVAGRTLYSTVSSGTETACLLGRLSASYPMRPGYASVFQVTEVGDDVADVQPGQVVFSFGGHRSHQRVPAREALPVPEGLPLEQAGFARLMGVTMSTLTTTTARPPDKVLVTGLGIVGLMGAQVFRAAGYEVWACDPDEQRRAAAEACGLRHVLPEAPVEDPELAGQVALALECSGHEAAGIAALKMVRKRGEVVQVATPWAQLAPDRSAHEVFHAVFHKYAVLRSGWEWEVARHETDFRTGSIFGNLRAALQWLAEGRVKAEGLYEVFSPREAPRVYAGLIARSLDKSAAVFDWRQL